MGCRSLWRFLSKKKHKPPLRYLRSQRDEGTSNQFRVDVQACLFSTIRYAYTASHSLEAAHSVVEKRIKKLVKNRTTAVLYFDGAPALEKQHTHRQRQELRTKALDNANKVVDNFVERVNNNQRIRKQHFITINKNLATAFRWDPVAKQSLIAYLRERGWDVVECPTEADTKIAEDCHPGDVVISSDSDSLVYRNISVVWRPISGGRFLVYNIDEVLSTLSLNRNQLTVLGIVSYNDYNKNIYGLGCATNYGIIKGFTEEGMEVPPMVEAYLTDSRVEFKNRDKLNFATSIQVFVGGRQTPVSFTTNNSSDDPGILTVEKVKARFAEASSMYKQRKSEEEMARQASKRSSSDTSTQRHKPSQRFNRYRTIDRPPPVEHKDITDTTKRKHSTAFVHRPRFSVKARTRKIKHEPPPAMKQYSWKSWKKKPESPAVDAIEAKPKPEEFAKSPSFKSPRPLGPMDKNQIVQELGREHPMAMLRVGTLAKNVKSALKDDVAIAKEAIGCLQEAVHEAYEIFSAQGSYLKSPTRMKTLHMPTRTMMTTSKTIASNISCSRSCASYTRVTIHVNKVSADPSTDSFNG
ncbi:PIN domain-like protein [Linnemannia elongata]|nr:PIN domain-like protein [Linnemannia elongata]